MMVLINNARRKIFMNVVAEKCHYQARVSQNILNLPADNRLPPNDNASSLAHEISESLFHKI